MLIRIDDLSGHDIIALLAAHLDAMHAHSPACSVHAFDLEKLKRPEVTVWSAHIDSVLAGCAALNELTPEHGEIKSMRTVSAFQRRGVAAALLSHIVDEATARGYRRLSLETGAQPYFEPARAFYASFGFEPCAPFEGYVEDPNSVFMTLPLGLR